MAWMVGFVQGQIRGRIEHIKPKEYASAEDTDFLGTILRMHGQNPDKIKIGDVYGFPLTNIGAGSDTTSVSLAGIMYNLIICPQKLQRLQGEIDQADKNGQLSELVTFQEAQRLPYLQACIKEGLRMHPATGLPLARVVPKEGANITGTFFPGGTVVGVNSWVAHANTEVFGPDAESFRPERWLESTEKASTMERSFLAFGAGSRTCIGKNISLMEISKIVPELIRRFNFTLTDPHVEIKMENVWFVKQKNIYCRVAGRWRRE
jgi:cytochrome P450